MAIYNFSAGLIVLPKPVLEQVQCEMPDYQGSGMNVLEMSHRSKGSDNIVKKAEQLLRELMAAPDNYKVVFFQSGTSVQLTMLPLDLAKGRKAYYLAGGSWGKKAYAGAVKLSKTVPFEPLLSASSEDTIHDHIPTPGSRDINPEAAYIHIATNNTIEGTSIYDPSDTNGVSIVADMSSNILAIRYNVEDLALIHAGAQKNIDPAGITVAIAREDFLNNEPALSTMLDYRVQAKASSLYSTPPVYNTYVVELVFEWVRTLSDVDRMEAANRRKSGLLHNFIDQSGFYTDPVKSPAERSIANAPFVASSKEPDAEFVAEATPLGFKNIKGHHSVDGMHVSLYNAFPRQGVSNSIEFMKKFEAENRQLFYYYFRIEFVIK